jgi:hypothetical protein
MIALPDRYNTVFFGFSKLNNTGGLFAEVLRQLRAAELIPKETVIKNK